MAPGLGTLEPGRAGNAYKLLGAVGSNLGSAVLLEGPHSSVSIATTRQPDSCSIHQQLGGTVSPLLTQLAKELWMWALSKNIILAEEYIPGITNCVADAESRTRTDRMDWSLHPELFRKINLRWGPLEVDLFASSLSNQLP